MTPYELNKVFYPGKVNYYRELERAKKELFATATTCHKCSCEGKLYAHHTIPKDNSSLIAVCKQCHKAEHIGEKAHNLM